MTEHFQVAVESSDGTSVLAVSGELDLAAAEVFAEALRAASEIGSETVIIDLRKLEFIDSTGLSLLVRGQRDTEQRGGMFGIVNGGPQVRRVIELTGLEKVLRVVASPDELTAVG
jgi:anti-anti-sigma factor